MAIINKMLVAMLALAFWALVTSTAIIMIVQNVEPKGTLLWCKLNQQMDQPICFPYSIKRNVR